MGEREREAREHASKGMMIHPDEVAHLLALLDQERAGRAAERARWQRLRAMLGKWCRTVSGWPRTCGADRYGNGMRDAKEQVGAIMAKAIEADESAGAL